MNITNRIVPSDSQFCEVAKKMESDCSAKILSKLEDGCGIGCAIQRSSEVQPALIEIPFGICEAFIAPLSMNPVDMSPSLFVEMEHSPKEENKALVRGQLVAGPFRRRGRM